MRLVYISGMVMVIYISDGESDSDSDSDRSDVQKNRWIDMYVDKVYIERRGYVEA